MLSSPLILVIRGGAIGDFILTLPALSALRQKFPTGRIEILGYPAIASLALTELADAVLPIESPTLAGFFVPDGELHPQWTSYFARFDLIISYACDPNETLARNIMRSSRARFIAAPHRPNEQESLHATEVFLKPLEQSGILVSSSTPSLQTRLKTGRRENEKAGDSSLNERSRIIAAHPGSGSDKKNWPEEKWVKLLQWLCSNARCYLLLIGGEAEGDKLRRLASKLPADKLELVQNVPLPDLAEKLSTADFFLGHDSGITHLAAALGLPGLVLWGPSNATIWRPRSEKMEILHTPEGLSKLPVETVIDTLQKLFNVRVNDE